MKELIKTISKKEWIFVGGLALVVLIITTTPYVLAFFLAPEGTSYNGLHTLSPGDVPVYYSYINQIKDGEYLVKNLFTAEDQGLGTFNIWWGSVGLMARFFNLSVIAAFHLSRVIMVPVFVVVAYLFLSYFFRDLLARKVALIFLLFSSGVGAYVAAPLDVLEITNPSAQIYSWPIDLWLTESNTFNILYQTSHFIASITLTLAIFLLMLLAFDKKKIFYAVSSGLLCLFYFNFHPYYVPTILGTLGIHLFILMFRQSRFLLIESAYLGTMLLISLPSVLYHFWLINNSETIAQRALQNVTFISPFIFVVLGYGYLLAGFILGLFFIVKTRQLNTKHLFLLSWLGVNVFLILSPFPFHSRYTQGLQIIFVIFTTIGLFELRGYLKNKLKPFVFELFVNNPALLGIIFIVMFSFSLLFNVGRDVRLLIFTPETKTSNFFYLSNDFMTTMDWLKNQEPGSIILANDLPAQFIPGFSGQRVFAAHAHETLFFGAKQPYIAWFFSNNDQDQLKIAWLKAQKINYVLHSLYEKSLGNFDPDNKDYLKIVVDLPAVRLYQVIH